MDCWKAISWKAGTKIPEFIVVEPISQKIKEMMERSSWIRRMFEEGERLKERFGDENVFDFTLGNPVWDPPDLVKDELVKIAGEKKPGAHRYMPNAGFLETRNMVAQHLSKRSGLDFTAGNVIMTAGAGGALNVIIKAIVDPGDEIIITAPYFAEYLFYADNHQAALKVAQTDKNFQLIPEKIEEAIGPKTRILLLNSPNNPTGAVYPENTLKTIGDILSKASEKFGRAIYLVMDEPYRKLTFDNVCVPEIFNCYHSAIVATSHSKDLRIPGERIGYIAIHPEIIGAEKIADAMTLANRILGFVNAPALMQRLIAGLQDFVPDMSLYSQNREMLIDGLTEIGFDLIKPQGGFYIFPKSPVEDDFKFVNILKKRNILVVPGAGFGRRGHFRISFCVEPSLCRAAIPGFEEAFNESVRTKTAASGRKFLRGG